MSCKEIAINIIVPLLAAIIGGGITLLGVILTIKHQHKIMKNEELAKYKPSFIIGNKIFNVKRQYLLI